MMTKSIPRKTIVFVGVLFGIAVIAGWLIFSGQIEQPVFQEENGVPPEITAQEVILIINDGQGSPQVFEAEFPPGGMTAFDLLKNKTEELNIFLKTKSYDMGIFIEAIGNKENGQEGKYWLYYVNNEIPMVAADKYELKPGDKVEFKFEKPPF